MTPIEEEFHEFVTQNADTVTKWIAERVAGADGREQLWTAQIVVAGSMGVAFSLYQSLAEHYLRERGDAAARDVLVQAYESFVSMAESCFREAMRDLGQVVDDDTSATRH